MIELNENSVAAEGAHPDAAELERLRAVESRLHCARRHPDYEYATTETARKSGESKMPEGHGWMPNNHVFGDRNWERFDHTEVEYWMRLKTDALKDDKSAYQLPEINLSKIKLAEYLQVLRERFPKGYMPSATGQVDFTSKPNYCEHASEILNLHHLHGTYVYTPDVPRNQEVSTYPALKKGVIYFAVELTAQPLRIITNLSEPEKETWVCTKRGDGTWCKWEQWYDFSAMPIHLYELKELVETYG